jgi:NADP-dependent 3-hydroxy acid dehydrogenase YdfG
VSWDIQAPADASVPFVSCDVSSEEKVASALSQTVSKLGAAPSVLINNCGLQYMAPVTEFPLDKWNQLLGIMVTGTFLCSKAVIPGDCNVLRSRIPTNTQRAPRHAAARLGSHREYIFYSRQGSLALQERVRC